jgi:hypothetical protein
MQDWIVRPFFIHEIIITSAVYLDVLENFVLPQTVAEVDGLIFEQDGAPAHFCATVCTFLDKRFPGWYISNGRPNNWPPQSPDLTPMNLFFWGYIKVTVYSEWVVSLPKLRQRITAAIAVVLWMPYPGCGVKWSFVVCRAITGIDTEFQ